MLITAIKPDDPSIDFTLPGQFWELHGWLHSQSARSA